MLGPSIAYVEIDTMVCVGCECLVYGVMPCSPMIEYAACKHPKSLIKPFNLKGKLIMAWQKNEEVLLACPIWCLVRRENEKAKKDSECS